MGDPTHDKVMWKRTVKQGFRTQGAPQAFSSIYPKTRICFTISCLSPTPLTLTGGYPRPPFSGENQLRAIANKSPGHEMHISNQTPCQYSSLLGRYIQTVAAMHMIIYSLPTVRGTESLKHRGFRRVKSYSSSASADVGFHYWANACCQVPVSLIHCAPGSA